jgi:hypothetical protein
MVITESSFSFRAHTVELKTVAFFRTYPATGTFELDWRKPNDVEPTALLAGVHIVCVSI